MNIKTVYDENNDVYREFDNKEDAKKYASITGFPISEETIPTKLGDFGYAVGCGEIQVNATVFYNTVGKSKKDARLDWLHNVVGSSTDLIDGKFNGNKFITLSELGELEWKVSNSYSYLNKQEAIISFYINESVLEKSEEKIISISDMETIFEKIIPLLVKHGKPSKVEDNTIKLV